MPAPQASAIEGLATGYLQSAGIKGENAPDLAKAMASFIADGLAIFASQAMIKPGTPAAVDPISTSGAVVGPGMFMPPPAGGPGKSTLEPLATAALQSNGLEGENAPELAKVMAAALAEGINMFTSQVMVTPGTPVAGMVTTAPGTLM